MLAAVLRSSIAKQSHTTHSRGLREDECLVAVLLLIVFSLANVVLTGDMAYVNRCETMGLPQRPPALDTCTPVRERERDIKSEPTTLKRPEENKRAGPPNAGTGIL